MKTKKLNLNNLQVKSFITSLDEKNASTVKGGTDTRVYIMTVSIAVTLVTAIAKHYDKEQNEAK